MPALLAGRKHFTLCSSAFFGGTHLATSVVQALGIKPRTLRPMARAKLDKKDVAQLLSRGEEGEEPDPAAEADRIKGLGFAACAPTAATTVARPF